MARQPPVSKVLEDSHLPSGLLPDTVTAYTLEADCSFEVHLSRETYVTFGEGKDAEKVCFRKVVTGVIRDLQLTSLKGITTKQILVWLPVTSIIRSGPDTETLTFYLGPLGVALPVRWFQKQKS